MQLRFLPQYCRIEAPDLGCLFVLSAGKKGPFAAVTSVENATIVRWPSACGPTARGESTRMSSVLTQSKQACRPNNGPGAGGCAGLPFGHLNLRTNPFGELESHQRAAVALVETEPFVDRLSRSGQAVQFMGDPGRGKTTHLLAVMAHFPRAAYVHIPEERRPRIPCGNPLFIDEIQRLSHRRRRREYRRASRQGVSLAIGTHLDVSEELVGAGFDVQTVTVSEELDATRLRAMLNRRIEWVRRDAGPLPEITLRTADEMLARYGDNVRAIEGHLYELFQDLKEIREV